MNCQLKSQKIEINSLVLFHALIGKTQIHSAKERNILLQGINYKTQLFEESIPILGRLFFYF